MNQQHHLPKKSQSDSWSNSNTNNLALAFYPAYCHKVSPTFFTWVKLTAHDIHHVLTKQKGYEGQRLYFYKNHPIKYVRLTGIVLSETAYEKRWVFVLDDSSGSTIEFVGLRPTPPPRQAQGQGQGGGDAQKIRQQQRQQQQGYHHHQQGNHQDDDDESLSRQREEQDQKKEIDSTTTTTTTNNNNNNTTTLLLPDIKTNESRISHNGLNLTSLVPGTLVKIKGLIHEWWGTRQVHLERLSILSSTNDEVRSWRETLHFQSTVLSKPWYLPPEEQRRLRVEAEAGEAEGGQPAGEKNGPARRRVGVAGRRRGIMDNNNNNNNNKEERRRERERKRAEWRNRMAKWEERSYGEILKEWEMQEREREEEAGRCRQESRRLFGTSTLRAMGKEKKFEVREVENFGYR